MGIQDESTIDETNDEEDLVFHFKTESFDNMSMIENEHLDYMNDLNSQSGTDNSQYLHVNLTIGNDLIQTDFHEDIIDDYDNDNKDDLVFRKTESFVNMPVIENKQLDSMDELNSQSGTDNSHTTLSIENHLIKTEFPNNETGEDTGKKKCLDNTDTDYNKTGENWSILSNSQNKKEKKYSCDQCNFKASSKDLINKHDKRIHLGLYCLVCRKYFTSASDMNEHSCTEKTCLLYTSPSPRDS